MVVATTMPMGATGTTMIATETIAFIVAGIVTIVVGIVAEGAGQAGVLRYHERIERLGGEALERASSFDKAALACFVRVGRERLVFGAAPHPLASARGIALRVPCCAQALGDHPWPPARRMRRAPNGRSPVLRAVVGDEVTIALAREPELTADACELRQGDVAEGT